ncbi:MAG TPA: MFS transporter [Novosphingobium sp.]|nr:MFS transporter [Novosphingobium sp.]
MTPPANVGAAGEPSPDRRDFLVVAASCLGTVFEWYDFFIFGTLATVIAALFFPSASPTTGVLLALATFGAGFGVRPLGAFVFGYMGDRHGRKYTFLATMAIMGLATTAVGVLPTYADAGIWAPVLLVICRLAQGLALGGEYGGAAIYVAEHAPPSRRGLYTSCIQASVVGGFLLSLIVVLAATNLAPEAWAWRIPFLFSTLLLVLSIWMRLKLRESPIFEAVRDSGEIPRNPVKDSFVASGNVKTMLVALFGVAAGITVISYTIQFQSLFFLQNGLGINDNVARIVVGVGTAFGLFWFILFGWLSDSFGRKKLLVTGYALSLATLLPLFHLLGETAVPNRPEAVLQASQAHSTEAPPPCSVERKAGDAAASAPACAPADKIDPGFSRAAMLALLLFGMSLLSGMTYGPAAAILVELFPAPIRYTSLSIPYHFGTGYFGGFLPLISQFIVVRTGDPYAGFWYPLAVVAVALVVALRWLPETSGRSLN